MELNLVITTLSIGLKGNGYLHSKGDLWSSLTGSKESL